jgi:hypothetical protein
MRPTRPSRDVAPGTSPACGMRPDAAADTSQDRNDLSGIMRPMACMPLIKTAGGACREVVWGPE